MDIIKLLTKLGKTYHSYFGFECCDGKIYKIYNNEESGEYDYDTIIKESNMCVEYQTVIVKFNGETSKFWNHKPERYWYNEPSKLFRKTKSSRLPFLNTRNYIKVTDPYMSVQISSKDKGSPITIDDILFATRALCCDETRTINKYKLIEKTKDTLVIEPKIDNWSS